MVTEGINGSWCGGEGGGGERRAGCWEEKEGRRREGSGWLGGMELMGQGWGGGQGRGQGRDGEAEEGGGDEGGDEGQERAGVKAQGNGQCIQGDFTRPLTLRQQQPCSVRIIAPVLWMRTLRFQRPSNWLRVTQQGREMVACEQGEGQSQGMRSTGHRKGLGKARGEAEAGREISGWPKAWPTHNAVWRWRTPDETLHFAAVAPDGVLHGLAGDDGGPCKQEDRVRASWNLQQPAPRPPHLPSSGPSPFT